MSAGEFQGESNTWTKLLHTETIDAAWIAFKKNPSSQFVLATPRFTAVRQGLAMEVYLNFNANLQQKSIETLKRILWAKTRFFQTS